MDLKAFKDFVDKHPSGVLVRLIDGTEYKVPHRDCFSFNPFAEEPERRRNYFSSAFILWKDETPRLLNTLLVKEVRPLPGARNGNGRRPRRGRR